MKRHTENRIPAIAVIGSLFLGPANLVSSTSAADAVLVHQGRPNCRIVLGRQSPAVQQNIAQLLVRRIAKRTGCRLPIVYRKDDQQQATEEVVILIGDPSTNLLVESLCRQADVPSPTPDNVGPGGFVVYSLMREGKPWVVLAGSDDRGTVCAVGKFLRSIDFADRSTTVGRLEIIERIDPTKRMLSQPQKPAQWGNAFLDAPINRIREYVEDMAMWGTDSMLSLCAWQVDNPFREDADSRSVGKWKRVRDVLLHAQSLGMDVGYFDYPNCVYEDQTHLRKLGGKFRYPKDACPSIPEVREVLLENRENIYLSAKQAGLEFSFLIHNAHDFGGCDCDKCAPWMKTFLKLNEELYHIARKHHPRVKIYLTTWACSKEERRILFDFLCEKKPEWVLGVLDRPGVELPIPYVSVGWQTIFACGGHECYGKMGADPLPLFLQKKVQEFHDRGIRAVHTYSEGIYDDINNMVVAQVCRRPFRKDIHELLAEYCHAAFGTGSEDSLKIADLILCKFRHSTKGPFNAALRVIDPKEVQAVFEDVETRMPDWGKRGWQYGILKTRVQLEVLDEKAQSYEGWFRRIDDLLTIAASSGDDIALRTALEEAKSSLGNLESSFGQIEAESRRLTDRLYLDLYGTPERHAAHGCFRPALPYYSLVPKLFRRCEALAADAKSDRRKEGAIALLKTLRARGKHTPSSIGQILILRSDKPLVIVTAL